MTDIQLIEHLIARDERVTKQFFFEDCRPLFMSIVHTIFHEKADFDELISELYLHLMEDDARRLRQFQGRSSIYQWIKTVAIRFFLEKRDQMIEKESEEVKARYEAAKAKSDETYRFYTAEREKTAKLYFFEMIYLEMLVVRMKRIADSIIKDIEELKSEGKIWQDCTWKKRPNYLI